MIGKSRDLGATNKVSKNLPNSAVPLVNDLASLQGPRLLRPHVHEKM